MVGSNRTRIRSWKQLVIPTFTPVVPFQDVEVCIVADHISELRHVRKLSDNPLLLFTAIAKEIYATNGVKLRSMGNLQTWEQRGVLLLDPLIMPSKSLTEILSKLINYRSGIKFILIGSNATLYGPLFGDREEEHDLHLLKSPIHRAGSIQESGIFDDGRDWNN